MSPIEQKRPAVPQPQKTATPALQKTVTPPSAQQQMQQAVRETAKDLVVNAAFEKHPYLKLAFSNPYNLSLFFGSLTAAAVTMNPVLAAVALGTEAIWLLHGPESKTLQRILWDPRLEKIRLAYEAREREERMKDLPQQERDRVNNLVAKQEEINRLAAQNPSFTGELLRTELVKTRRLVDAFLEMAITCSRYENYLGTIDLRELERDRDRWQQRMQVPNVSGPELDVAKKNFAVIMKRIEKLHELRDYLRVARGQLDLIENSFRLIADQIVMMQSPAELSGQLNDLLDGVESIRQTAIDTEKILKTMEV
ncbi:MAG: hypothetical protein JO197_13255 [Acidobacteria bacterium]|nr:hypothetical protein [Acidobacteriota bacterium]MBV9477662.1 hypothetical protein [Acidobacteriota bacterium]